jgi:hypothetical protein
MWLHGNTVILTISFGYGKFSDSNSIIVANFVETLIPNFWFEKVFPTDMCYLGTNMGLINKLVGKMLKNVGGACRAVVIVIRGFKRYL